MTAQFKEILVVLHLSRTFKKIKCLNTIILTKYELKFKSKIIQEHNYSRHTKIFSREWGIVECSIVEWSSVE